MWAKIVIAWEMARGAIFLYKELKSAYNNFRKASIEKAIQKRKNVIETKTEEVKDVLNGPVNEQTDKKLEKLYRELNSSYGN